MNAIELLGTLMNSGMSRYGSRRIENSIGSSWIGAPGGILGQLLGGAGGSAAGSGGLMDMLGKMAGSLSLGGSDGPPGGGRVPEFLLLARAVNFCGRTIVLAAVGTILPLSALRRTYSQRELMMKTSSYIYFPLLIAVFLTGCATGPTLTQEQILGQYQQIAKLEKGLKDAATQGVHNLAPDGYRAAKQKLEEAVAEARADRQGTANSAATGGLQTLAKANENAERSRELLREVLAARDRAYHAGCVSVFPDSTDDLDTDLRKLASLVERGRLADAKQRRQRLIAGYEQLELAALQEGTVEAAQAAIEDAGKKDAKKVAPKTLKLAEEEMKLALSVLEADRSRTDKANAHAMRAKWLAERSIAITELVKDFERRDYSAEELVLWYQKQLSNINEPLGEELPFNQANRNVVMGMQQSIRELKMQRDDTAAQRSQYEQELSLSSEQRAAVDKVQSLFTAAEANVYQQRRNVLISAHGFRFPPGGSEIGTDNFALMNRIIQAVKTFPESHIEISGHTDSTGSAAVNMNLSRARADNVARFLVEVGDIPASRIMARGYGEERPVASNETMAGRAANRRVEVLINNQ